MNNIYDLHAHSSASDGTLSPTVLMQHAAQAGVSTIALTDHDTLFGLAEARAAAKSYGLSFVPGVEISANWHDNTIHIVGLQVADDTPILQQGLLALREKRDQRARTIGHLLGRDGPAGDWFALARAQSSGHVVGRAHFARALIAAGHASSMREVFKKYLVPGKPGYAPGVWAPLSEVVSWINAAGGQAVIAHPARYGLKRRRLRRLIGDFVSAGGTAIEVVAGSHCQDDYYVMAQLARDFNLLASVGSDFHDPKASWGGLGQLPSLPPGCTPVWHAWS